MKKCLVCLITLFIFGCTNLSKIETNINELSTDEFIEKINNKDDFVLLVTKEECPYCESLLEEIQNNSNDKFGIIWKLEINSTNREKLLPVLYNTVKDLEYVPYVGVIKEGIEYKNSSNANISKYENFKKFFDDI